MTHSLTVRPFDWRDLPALHRGRRYSVLLDSALVLTRGPLLLPGALLSYLAPSMGVFTSVCNGTEQSEHTLIGQIMHLPGAQLAHLTFLTPHMALDSSALPASLDYLATLAGERGAFRLLADVDEGSFAYEALRRTSFAIYTRQRIWQLTGQPKGTTAAAVWRPATTQDSIAIRSLYTNLVPGLVQQVEPYPNRGPQGLVYRQVGELLAYVELRYGHRGIWAQPFFHPDIEDVSGKLVELLQHLPYRRSRPIYLCIRSYQAWLEPAIEEMGAESGPRQAVMVKHLVVPQKSVRMFALPVLEGGHPEISAPIVRSETKSINGTT